MLHHLKIHFKKMRPKKCFFIRSMSLDPTKPRKKLADQQTPPKKKESTQLPFLFPSKFCLFQAWLLYLCHGLYFPRTIPTIAPFCSHGTNRLDLWKLCTLDFRGWEKAIKPLKGGKIFGGRTLLSNMGEMRRLGMVWVTSTQVFCFWSVFVFFRKNPHSFFWSFFFCTCLWYRKKHAQWVFMVDGAGPLHGGLCQWCFFQSPHPKLVWPLLFSQRSKLTSHGSLKVWVALEDSDWIP